MHLETTVMTMRVQQCSVRCPFVALLGSPGYLTDIICQLRLILCSRVDPHQECSPSQRFRHLWTLLLTINSVLCTFHPDIMNYSHFRSHELCETALYFWVKFEIKKIFTSYTFDTVAFPKIKQPMQYKNEMVCSTYLGTMCAHFIR